tara:strand:+ start:510 stop:677 length:168 start_codon:yes stop_codon:yes gene_type:complete
LTFNGLGSAKDPVIGPKRAIPALTPSFGLIMGPVTAYATLKFSRVFSHQVFCNVL